MKYRHHLQTRRSQNYKIEWGGIDHGTVLVLSLFPSLPNLGAVGPCSDDLREAAQSSLAPALALGLVPLLGPVLAMALAWVSVLTSVLVSVVALA